MRLTTKRSILKASYKKLKEGGEHLTMNQNTLKAKEELVSKIAADVKEHQAMAIVEYRGLSVSEISDLRKQLKKENASMVVFKNSLVERAMANLGYTGFDEWLTGPNAYVFLSEVTGGSKVIMKYSRRNPKLVVKGGVVEGQKVDAAKLKELSNIPGREGLISMFLSVLQAPVRQFACTVKAIAEKQ